ncbi:MAG: hypothetical protein L3J75_09075 [Methylococcaceae bacterium]|nr:hypothetical protein [Methylococcaceae bacterium]
MESRACAGIRDPTDFSRIIGEQALACSCYEECRLIPAPQKMVTNEGIFGKATTLTHQQEMSNIIWKITLSSLVVVELGKTI